MRIFIPTFNFPIYFRQSEIYLSNNNVIDGSGSILTSKFCNLVLYVKIFIVLYFFYYHYLYYHFNKLSLF